MDQLEEVQLNSEKDVVKWVLEKSGQFTTKSMYRWISHRGVVNKRLQLMWGSRLPLKLKTFIWLITHDRLQTGVELRKRKWKGSGVCNICKKPEPADHILFTCIVARFLWTCFKEVLGWERIPVGWQDFLDTWIPLGCKDYHTKLFLLTMVTWALWTSRNKRTIEGKFPRKPSDLLFKTKSFLQRWKPLLRRDDQAKAEGLVAQVSSWAGLFLKNVERRCIEEDFC